MSDNVAPQFHEFLHDRIILDRTNVLIELHGIGERYEQLRVVLDRFQPGSKAERIIVADVDPVQPMQGDLKVGLKLSLIHISEPTRLGMISYAVFCLKKKNKN